ncbi:recombinase family protein [Bengtsoniella intestinalis]|uniref:recombinase family protein n=1 Tax=Bengtsoniella intestinalis TaxID=3073143 RepID=UPI00391F0C4C
MAQNRSIPYGYQMVNGAIIVHPSESEMVKTIFQLHTDGSSYLTIANWLTAHGIYYMPNRPDWNKNIIARMLQNTVYLGTEKYPTIINDTQFHTSQAAKKPYTHTEPKELKKLKPLLVCSQCGEKIQRRLKTDGTQRWYCPTDINHIALTVSDDSILQDILSLQNIVAHVNLQAQTNNSISLETVRLQNEIDRLLEQSELQVEEIKDNIFKLASLKYSLCPDTHHAEQAMLDDLKGSDTVNAKLLIQLVERIQVSNGNVTGFLLKCGNHIQNEGTI